MSKFQSSAQPQLGNWSRLIWISLLGLMTFYALLDGAAPRGVVMWKVTFGIFYASIIAIAFYILLQQKLLLYIYSRTYLILISGLLAYGVIAAVGSGISDPIYFTGDLALLSLLFFYTLMVPYFYHALTPHRVLILAGCLLMGSVLSYISSRFALFPDYMHGTRFDAPRVLVYAGLATAAITLPGTGRIVALALFASCLPLVWLSGWRAELIFFLTALIGLLAGDARAMRRMLVIGVVTVCILLVLLTIGNSLGGELRGVFDNTRFAKLFEAGGDRSFLHRLLEVQDVLLIFRDEATWGQRLFGFGHGATYMPVFSFPEPNMTEDYSVHNIHINMFLWLYRYGIVGIGFYVTFVVLAVWHYAKLLMVRQAGLRTADICFTLGAMIIVIRSIFYSPINDPINLFVISGFLYSLWARRRRHAAQSE